MRPSPISRLPLPSWVITLAGFGLLTGLVVAVFLWQLREADRDLSRNILDRSRMMATIIDEHLANAQLADATIDTVITTFLRDKARFVEYLNSIDPLQDDELTALARETGLLGISLVYLDGAVVSGPARWGTAEGGCEPASAQVVYDPTRQTGQLVHPGTTPTLRCIRLGMDAKAVLDLRRKTALPALLAGLSALPGIHAVRLEQVTNAGPPPPVRLLVSGGRDIAEARLATSRGILVVALDATNHRHRLTQLRRQFILFSSLLAGLGLFFSWLLYRVQEADLGRTRAFERLLAKEHEDAALGRATATIAHEIRNPLNAISMGLQRLCREGPALNGEQLELLSAMEAAVGRAGMIISELQRFTRPLSPHLEQIEPAQLLRRIAALYQHRCLEKGIALELRLQEQLSCTADPGLIAELMENLIKNSIEAQPAGGYITIEITPCPAGLRLTMTNSGCSLKPEDLGRPGEPYFTTKTRGTGLGLALCRRIAEAHGGSLTIRAQPEHDRFTVELTLPEPVGPTAEAAVHRAQEESHAHPDR